MVEVVVVEVLVFCKGDCGGGGCSGNVVVARCCNDRNSDGGGTSTGDGGGCGSITLQQLNVSGYIGSRFCEKGRSEYIHVSFSILIRNFVFS